MSGSRRLCVLFVCATSPCVAHSGTAWFRKQAGAPRSSTPVSVVGASLPAWRSRPVRIDDVSAAGWAVAACAPGASQVVSAQWGRGTGLDAPAYNLRRVFVR